MELGHGFPPRIDARSFRAAERCLTRDVPGLFSEGLLPWAILEGPWALQRGGATIELCRDRGVSFLIDTQAWRYRDARTFLVDKFLATPYAPPAPLTVVDRSTLSAFVEAGLKTQESLGASAYLLPGVVPRDRHDAVRADALALLELAQEKLPEARPCVALVGAHTSSMEAAYRLVDDLPHWIDGVYVQLTPAKPIHDSSAKIIDGLMLVRHIAQQGFTVIAERLAGIAPLPRAAGIPAADAGLGEGESFSYGEKVKNHEPHSKGQRQPRLLGGRVYVPQLGRSVSAAPAPCRVSRHRRQAAAGVRASDAARVGGDPVRETARHDRGPYAEGVSRSPNKPRISGGLAHRRQPSRRCPSLRRRSSRRLSGKPSPTLSGTPTHRRSRSRWTPLTN